MFAELTAEELYGAKGRTSTIHTNVGYSRHAGTHHTRMLQVLKYEYEGVRPVSYTTVQYNHYMYMYLAWIITCLTVRKYVKTIVTTSEIIKSFRH